MKIIDASAFIAYFLEQDAHHKKAKLLIDSKQDSILVPYVIIAEVLAVLTQKHSKYLAQKFLEFIHSDAIFIIQASNHSEEFKFWNTIKNNISFADIVCVFYARENKADLLTFDKKQFKLFQELMN